MMLAACTQNGRALYDASAALQDDREVVLAACNQNGYALQFASDALQDDREVVMVAAAQDYQWTLDNPTETNDFAICQALPALRAEFQGGGILTHVREQLQLRSSFFGTFLCAVAIPAQAAGGGGTVAAAPGGTTCLLPRLDVRSGSPIKKMIADFAGVPYRSSWRSLQLAAAHLAAYL